MANKKLVLGSFVFGTVLQLPGVAVAGKKADEGLISYRKGGDDLLAAFGFAQGHDIEVGGEDCPQFKEVGRPSLLKEDDQICAFVETVAGENVVVDWGHSKDYRAAVAKIGSRPASEQELQSLPAHFEQRRQKKQERRCPVVKRSSAVATPVTA
ncbi:MAG: hypothetical protein WC763_03415 [Candidatus Paceibacterota bacterium]|jgi:hypothetical protein